MICRLAQVCARNKLFRTVCVHVYVKPHTRTLHRHRRRRCNEFSIYSGKGRRKSPKCASSVIRAWCCARCTDDISYTRVRTRVMLCTVTHATAAHMCSPAMREISANEARTCLEHMFSPTRPDNRRHIEHTTASYMPHSLPAPRMCVGKHTHTRSCGGFARANNEPRSLLRATHTEGVDVRWRRRARIC